MSEEQIRDAIRKAAAKWGASPAYLSDVLNGRRAPGPAVLAPMGYVRRVVTTYEKASPQ